MQKIILSLLFTFILTALWSQELVKLPTDLRSHNLTKINSNILNPAFSLESNDTQSFSFWSRWQWQTIDTDPTTLFVNYNRLLNENSAAGVSFFQNNTGLYLNTGAVLNYAYVFDINATTKLAVGANLSIFGQVFADKQVAIPDTYIENGTIVQISPGVKLTAGSLGVSFSMENAYDYHFKLKEANTQEFSNVYTGIISYDVPVVLGSRTEVLHPSIYLRKVPEYETQVGLMGSLYSDKYWVQLGYNSYYGVSVGGGATILNKISLGAIVEFASKVKSRKPSLELVAAYSFGKLKSNKTDDEKLNKIEEEKEIIDEITPKKDKKEKPKKVKSVKNDTLKKVKIKKSRKEKREEQERLKEEKMQKEHFEARQAEVAMLAKKRRDSLDSVQKPDSIVQVQSKDIEPKLVQKKEKSKKVKKSKPKKVKKEKVKAKKPKSVKNDTLKKVKIKKSRKEKREEQERLKEEKMQKEHFETRQAEVVMMAKKRRDSLNNLYKFKSTTQSNKTDPKLAPKKIILEVGEKYEEINREYGLDPGFYLIVNVYKTKKYMAIFMNDLKKKGLNPKSFKRSKKGLNYIYLGKYANIDEARNTRNSNFNGKYNEKIWIFRVIEN